MPPSKPFSQIERPADGFLSWPARILPRLRQAGRYPLADQHFTTAYWCETHAMHVHDYEGVVRIAGREYALRPGDITFSPADMPSCYHLPRPGMHWCVHFYPETEADPPGRAALRLPWHAPAGPEHGFVTQRLAWIADTMAHRHATGPAGEVAAARGAIAFQEILLFLHGRAADTRGDGPRQAGTPGVEAAAGLLSLHFAQDWSARRLAQTVQLSQNYLARKFRQRYGMTIPHFLLLRRLERAFDLIGQSDLPIKRIAADVGLPDAQHFNKQFRRQFGVAPMAVRSDAMSRKKVM